MLAGAAGMNSGHQEEWALAADLRLGRTAARTLGMCDVISYTISLSRTRCNRDSTWLGSKSDAPPRPCLDRRAGQVYFGRCGGFCAWRENSDSTIRLAWRKIVQLCARALTAVYCGAIAAVNSLAPSARGPDTFRARPGPKEDTPF